MKQTERCSGRRGSTGQVHHKRMNMYNPEDDDMIRFAVGIVIVIVVMLIVLL